MQVVNVREETYEVYGGRLKTAIGRIWAPPDQTVDFGNPYPVKRYGLTVCLRLYRGYLFKRAREDAEFKAALLELRGKRVGCFCAPKPCHLDVIKEWLDLQPQETKGDQESVNGRGND